jgi:hypothetical protein
MPDCAMPLDAQIFSTPSLVTVENYHVIAEFACAMVQMKSVQMTEEEL